MIILPLPLLEKGGWGDLRHHLLEDFESFGLSMFDDLFDTKREKRDFFIKDGSHIQNDFVFADPGNDRRVNFSQVFFEIVHREGMRLDGDYHSGKFLERKRTASHLRDIFLKA